MLNEEDNGVQVGTLSCSWCCPLFEQIPSHLIFVFRVCQVASCCRRCGERVWRFKRLRCLSTFLLMSSSR